MPAVRRLLVLGALGAAAAALARRLRAPDREPWTAHEPEGPPTGPGERPSGAHRSTLEREGPRIGDEDLAEAITFPDDATLRDRVESELFRDPEVPKGLMNVDAAAGVVTLRGTVDAGLVDDLETRVAAVEGVVRVENLLTAAEGGASGEGASH